MGGGGPLFWGGGHLREAEFDAALLEGAGELLELLQIAGLLRGGRGGVPQFRGGGGWGGGGWGGALRVAGPGGGLGGGGIKG